MRLLGHTLGTPHLDVPDALRLFSEVGLEGAEVIWQDGYLSGLPQGDLSAARSAAKVATSLGITIDCLTPYMTGIADPDPQVRSRDAALFRSCIQAAIEVGAHFVRVYAGSFNPDAETEQNRQQKLTAIAPVLRELGDYADSEGVSLCIENHFGTLAVSAADTRDLIELAASPGVAALYDQANLTFTHCEDFEEAIDVQGPWIRHVQAKDLVFTDPSRPFTATAVNRVSESERTVRSRVVGDGIVPWRSILEKLHSVGYDGTISFEYEARWHPHDLPKPRAGFALSVEYFQKLLRELHI